MTSRFGAELDSLADIVSFGVAPALLAKSLMDIGHWPPFASVTITRLGWVMLALFAAGAAVRLARYNVEAVKPADGSLGSKGKDYFVGLPSPAAAGLAVSPVLFYHWLTEQESGIGLRHEYARWLILCLPVLMLGLAWLMVSRVRYMHLGNRLFAGRQRLWPVLGVLAAAVFTVRFWELAGMLLFGGYVVGFLIWDLGRTARSARLRRRQARQASSGTPPGGSPPP
jgi:CDP-diacylglycerol--serine O-phosphatidyltransferase